MESLQTSNIKYQEAIKIVFKMVYLKVSDGSETRKLQVTPGEITFDRLKEQLATYFPRTLGDASSGLSLQYRDADGDVITLSSDQELQEALSQLQEDGVWKLHIRSGQHKSQNSAPRSTRRSQGRKRCEATSLLHNLFEPSVKPFGLFSDVWDDLEQHLQLLHQLSSEVFSSSEKSSEKTNAAENQQNTTSEATTKSEGESTTSSTVTAEQQTVEDPDETVKSIPHAAGSSNKDERKSSVDKSDSQWHTRRFVTWEPRVHIGPFGFFHSRLTPVVYKVAYKSSDNGCCSSATKGDKGEAETKAQEQAASSVAEKKVEPSTTESASVQPSETATLAAQWQIIIAINWNKLTMFIV